MALIITPELVNKIALLVALDPIKYDDFDNWRKEYKRHNKKIGERKKVDLSKEPEKFYFDKDDVIRVLNEKPNYLTFMFACEDNEKYKNFRVMMCGMNELGTPQVDGLIFEGYQHPTSIEQTTNEKVSIEAVEDKSALIISESFHKEPIARKEFDCGRKLFENRLSFYEDTTNWRGVTHKDPFPFKAVIENDKNMNRIVVFLAYNDGHFNVLVAGSKGDFVDMVPMSRNDTQYKVYDNGTQCCQ